MSSLVTTTYLKGRSSERQLLCLNYQKHSLLVQHSQVHFYGTVFLPGVVLGNADARKHFWAANSEILSSFWESCHEFSGHFHGIHTRNLTMIHSIYLWAPAVGQAITLITPKVREPWIVHFITSGPSKGWCQSKHSPSLLEGQSRVWTSSFHPFQEGLSAYLSDGCQALKIRQIRCSPYSRSL